MKKFKKKQSEKITTGVTLLRLGNFLIKRRADGTNAYVAVSTADGGWKMEWRDDTLKYAWILMLAAEPKAHKSLEMWAVITYHMASCHPDMQFFDEVLAALEGLNRRAAEYKKDEEEKEKDATEG